MNTILVTGLNCDQKPPVIEPPETPIEKDCFKAEASVRGIIVSLLNLMNNEL